MVAKAFIEDGAKQMDRANFRPGLAESISCHLGLVQPGLTSLLKLLGIGCEAIGPVLLRVNGNVLILTPFFALEACVTATAPGLVATQSLTLLRVSKAFPWTEPDR